MKPFKRSSVVSAFALVACCQMSLASSLPDDEVASPTHSELHPDLLLYDETQLPAELLPLEHRQVDPDHAPVRAKREGFVDLSAIPEMMMDMLSSFGHGLSSMMGYSQQVTHHMVHGLHNAVRPKEPVRYHESQGASYKKPPPPKVFYGSWTPIFSKPSYKPPQPSYQQPSHPAPVQYVPSSQDSYGSPAAEPVGSSDSYGTPVAHPVTSPPYQPPPTPNYVPVTAAPYQPPSTPSYQPPAPEEPYQTPYEPSPSVDPITNFHPTSTPLHGTFSSPHGQSVEVPEGHSPPAEYTDDKGHVDPILSNTLFYKDTKKIKFHQKDDGHLHDREVSIDAHKFNFEQAHEGQRPAHQGFTLKRHTGKKPHHRNPFVIPRVKGFLRRKKLLDNLKDLLI